MVTLLPGYYNSIEEAAIAYNKAADILEKKGINKHFERNYIEEMPAKSIWNYTILPAFLGK